MSCRNCKIWSGNFKTEQQYYTIEKNILDMVKDGELLKIEINEPSPFRESFYQCKSCNQMWKLSMPDQAYRGGWFEKD